MDREEAMAREHLIPKSDGNPNEVCYDVRLASRTKHALSNAFKWDINLCSQLCSSFIC
jgi:hypothetical protein